VPIPGHGSNKINAAFSLGGPNLLVQTVEQVTDLHIDGYVEIGFAGFASVVDSVDGVDICVPFRMNDKKAGINLKKGCQVLDGKNALGFVRARYSDPRGDIGRAERQRQFLAAIMKKAATPSTVFVPTRYWGFTHASADGLIVGEDTSMRDASRVLLAMRAVSNDQGLSLVVPIQSVNYPTAAGSSVKWDTERAKALFTMLREDEPLESPPAGTDGKPSGG
jgi:LCP family protein required for cell wall assembly